MKVGARFYDPIIGRWIQKDPILDGFNWWVYCDNEPVNYVDPEGKQRGGSMIFPSPFKPPAPYINPPGGYFSGGPINTPGPYRPGQRPRDWPDYRPYDPPYGEGRRCGQGAHLCAIIALVVLVSRFHRKRENV